MPGCRCTCVVACLLLLPSTLPLQCDPADPTCRTRQCNYQPIWLIPGRADASCTRPGAKRVVDVDPAQVVITPEVVKMPGCFTVQMNNVHVRDHQHTSSLFAKVEYQWWNVNQFSHLKCQNASNNGCGGYGNNCYYCDICESLSELGSSQSRSTFAQQLKGINCPDHAGLYTFRKEFCFNDWSSFDADGDCELDFFQGDKLSDYRSALASLQQIGYGTVVAKLRLAFNATDAIEQKKTAKESQIEESVLRELEERRSSWDVNNGQFDRFRDWYVQYRKNLWHRDDYLPWLLYENEIACLRLTFDICERMPQRMAHGPRYTCASP